VHGPLYFRAERDAVELQVVLGRENFAGNSGRRKEITVPVIDALNLGKMLARILLTMIFAPAVCSHSLPQSANAC